MGPSPAEAAEGVYGLAVTGSGLVSYVDASFGVRSGMASVEVVVDVVEELPRGKALTDRVLGDVNGDGQVTLDDALLLVTYVANPADPSLPAGIGQAVVGSGGDWVAGAIRNLTNHPGGRLPTWSPDGRHLAFTFSRSSRDGYRNIYVMEVR